MAPEDPLTPMAAASAQAREVYTSLVAAGFTEYQASVIVGTMLAQLALSNSSND